MKQIIAFSQKLQKLKFSKHSISSILPNIQQVYTQHYAAKMKRFTFADYAFRLYRKYQQIVWN